MISPQTPKIVSKISPLFEFIKKQQENRKFAQTVELTATLALISFFMFFAIRPTALTISALIGEIKSKELLKQEMRKKINQVILAQDLFSQVQERYSIIESSLPLNPRFYQATSQLDGTFTKNQLDISEIDFSLQEDERFFTTSVSTASSFTTSLNLITNILSNRRLFEIPSVGFSIGKETSSSREIMINLPINIYYWNQSVNQNEKK